MTCRQHLLRGQLQECAFSREPFLLLLWSLTRFSSFAPLSVARRGGWVRHGAGDGRGRRRAIGAAELRRLWHLLVLGGEPAATRQGCHSGGTPVGAPPPLDMARGPAGALRVSGDTALSGASGPTREKLSQAAQKSRVEESKRGNQERT